MGGQFEGKVALVSGSGSGIGRASALAFARNGAKVIVAGSQTGGRPQEQLIKAHLSP